MARGWVCLRSSGSWGSRGLRCLLFLAVVLATCSRAQEDTPTVTIRMATDRLRTTAIIPARIRSEGAIYIIGNETFSIQSTNPPNVTSSFQCDGSNCTLTLRSELDMAEMETDPLVVTLEFSNRQTLILTIRENLVDSCREYPVPKLFMPGDSPYEFTCEPLENATEVQQVVWRKFSTLEDVEMFLNGSQDFMSNVITNNSNFTLIGAKSMQLRVSRTMTSNAKELVSYFVPSFVMMGAGMMERRTAETLIILGPEITTPHEEFSININQGSEKAQNLTMIACEADTFPRASASWVLTNTEFPNGVGLRNYEGFNATVFLLDSGSSSLDMVLDAIVQLRDPTYEDDGLFTCTVDNGVNVVTQEFRLRLKSHLRPLWPALGIMGVAIMVSLMMLGFFTAEKIIEKKKQHQYMEGSSNHSDSHRSSSTSSSSGQSSNSKGKKHSGVKRLSSNKPLIEESTL